ncbi:hypothetical protein D3OALGA1CA_888 [Olavius algarvensis associated proteobacterium Delta 3]|nr:hypothetical protein D3OALGA1CA_888 [Olavius algarvensis associated proteobacterium Delta 3]CAB5143738.1 hypothetical protein D3OALGB2SA_4391 [Olavius algarvensis associated proteobacterium Delta 3]
MVKWEIRFLSLKMDGTNEVPNFFGLLIIRISHLFRISDVGIRIC